MILLSSSRLEREVLSAWHNSPLVQWSKIRKKVQEKNLVKSNRSISRKNFLTKNPFFAISKMAKHQFFNWGEKFKIAKNLISRKFFFDLFDFMSFFFAWTFLNFLAFCAFLVFFKIPRCMCGKRGKLLCIIMNLS